MHAIASDASMRGCSISSRARLQTERANLCTAHACARLRMPARIGAPRRPRREAAAATARRPHPDGGVPTRRRKFLVRQPPARPPVLPSAQPAHRILDHIRPCLPFIFIALSSLSVITSRSGCPAAWPPWPGHLARLPTFRPGLLAGWPGLRAPGHPSPRLAKSVRGDAGAPSDYAPFSLRAAASL